jgi:hypothetical protein
MCSASPILLLRPHDAAGAEKPLAQRSRRHPAPVQSAAVRTMVSNSGSIRQVDVLDQGAKYP